MKQSIYSWSIIACLILCSCNTDDLQVNPKSLLSSEKRMYVNSEMKVHIPNSSSYTCSVSDPELLSCKLENDTLYLTSNKLAGRRQLYLTQTASQETIASEITVIGLQNSWQLYELQVKVEGDDITPELKETIKQDIQSNFIFPSTDCMFGDNYYYSDYTYGTESTVSFSVDGQDKKFKYIFDKEGTLKIEMDNSWHTFSTEWPYQGILLFLTEDLSGHYQNIYNNVSKVTATHCMIRSQYYGRF